MVIKTQDFFNSYLFIIIGVVISIFYKNYLSSSKNKRAIYKLAYFNKLESAGPDWDFVFTYKKDDLSNEFYKGNNGCHFTKNEAVIVMEDSLNSYFGKILPYRILNQKDCDSLANKVWYSFPIEELQLRYDESMD
jgi:hypothetical protein